MIQKIGAENPSFKGARVNILASSDSHGNIMRLPRVLKTIENNAKEIFPKAEEKSTANFLTFIGDWFINPSKKGFLTHPELSNGDLQNVALLRTIDNIKATLKKLATKASGVIDGKIGLLNVLFTLGNHDLDGGDGFIANVMKKNPMKTLITNVNLDKSPTIKKLSNNGNIVKSAVYSIPDDKNSDLLHKILFVSATIPDYAAV